MRNIIKIGLPAVALAMFLFALFSVLGRGSAASATRPNENNHPLPAKTPYEQTVAGAGLVEAQSENVSAGTQVAGIVTDVFVQVGDRVKTGDPLFKLDDRILLAQQGISQAAIDLAEADLRRLQNLPRPEQVRINQAQVNSAQTTFDQADRRYGRLEKLNQTNALSYDEFDDARRTRDVAKSELNRAIAQLELLQAGTWGYELEVSQAALRQARNELKQIEAQVELLTVRALVDMEVLQVNVRPGEYVGPGVNQNLVVLGDTTELNIRVDIDEHDIPRFRSDAPAVAILKGAAQATYPLKFVRIEPFVIPKRSLTGDPTERTDTRVLQVIYQLEKLPKQIFVGQQMDVFIEE